MTAKAQAWAKVSRCHSRTGGGRYVCMQDEGHSGPHANILTHWTDDEATQTVTASVLPFGGRICAKQGKTGPR